MQVKSIISNTISEEVLQSGHLSIRFLTDGFSLLLEDRAFRPVILNRFIEEAGMSRKSHIKACKDWLIRNALYDEFKGEVSITYSSSEAVLIPGELFSADHSRLYLEQVTEVAEDAIVHHKKLKERPYVLVYLVPQEINFLVKKFGDNARVVHSSEVIFSVSDQVNASDHQRGFMLIEVQNNHLDIIVIKNDELVLSNQVKLKSTEEYVYHTLNTFQQLDLDRTKTPLFYAGTCDPEDDSMKNLSRYIKRIYRLPYFILDIEKTAIPEHIILSEATKCE